MSLVATIFISAATAYAAPTSHEAYIAYTDRLFHLFRQTGDALHEQELRLAPDFPIDVTLERCLPKTDRAVTDLNGAVRYYDGYDCMMEVMLNAAPGFRGLGFFRHNGLEWEFFGETMPARAPSPAEFDPLKGEGLLLEKPGSIVYDGAPQNPFNDDYDPYRDIFETSEELKSFKY